MNTKFFKFHLADAYLHGASLQLTDFTRSVHFSIEPACPKAYTVTFSCQRITPELVAFYIGTIAMVE